MLINEAVLVAQLLDDMPFRSPVTVLDCGSGRREDRTIIQPHIAAVFSGYSVTWTDKRPGRDVVQVDWESTGQRELFLWPDVVTCLSLLEHVKDPMQTLKNVVSCVGPQKYLIVSVPRSYPRHDCPIDNLWRPSSDELGAMVYSIGLDVLSVYETPPETFGGVENASASVVFAWRDS